MNILEYAKLILQSGRLEDKLIDTSVVTDFSGKAISNDLPNIKPFREREIVFSEEQIKFPKKSSFHLDEKKALAMHFFANHELLAIEMMAAAILYLPVDDEYSKRIRVGLLGTIQDEIKHFKMYVKRINEFGVGFGDFPVNDYFWRQMQKVKTFDEYFSVMALTFEAANLDFAKYYSDIFHGVDDDISSKIMNVVYQDEISHVGFGVYWLNQWRQDNSLWDYYKMNLPDLLTPARAKGIAFDSEGRFKSGMDQEFIDKIQNYKDEFIVTNRKEW
jgi:uncharacterized ferritin-like protein (DUF455 family)